MNQPQGPLCQSCGMPMGTEDDFGTDSDGSKSRDYCQFCFVNGKFTEPDITMEQMVDIVAGFVATEMKMPEAQAKETAQAFIPKLRRWQAR